MIFRRSMTVPKNVSFVNKKRDPTVNHLAPDSNLKKNEIMELSWIVFQKLSRIPKTL